MTRLCLMMLATCICCASCTTKHLAAFSNQQWHVDANSGHAVSSSGLEVAFGSEWMITDTTLMQTYEQVSAFPKLESHLANGIAQFPEIEVDSILFYNPHRGLLFATYHQVKPLKPTSEIYLYDETTGAYSKEYARIFGRQYTSIDDSGWEAGPTGSVYTNVHYRPKNKRVVLLQRIPFKDINIAVFHIWENNTDNIERLAIALEATRNLAVENLRLALSTSE